MAVTPHGVLPRDSHEISPTIGGVHKLMILLRDLLKEKIQKKIFDEEMGGSGGPRPPYEILDSSIHLCQNVSKLRDC